MHCHWAPNETEDMQPPEIAASFAFEMLLEVLKRAPAVSIFPTPSAQPAGSNIIFLLMSFSKWAIKKT